MCVAICNGCGKYRAQLYSRQKTGEDGSSINESLCDECNRGLNKGPIGCIAALAVFVAPVLLLLGYCTSQRETKADTAADTVASDKDAPQSSLAVQILDARVGGELRLKTDLKDGDSARFSDEFVSRLSGGNLMLCGEVNSKNGFGAYTGFKRFIASPNPEVARFV